MSRGVDPAMRAAEVDEGIWKWAFASGAVTLLLGLVMAAFPVINRGGFALGVGWILLISGLTELAADLRGRRLPEAQTLLFLPIITICAGVALILNPFLDFFTLFHLVTLSLAARGIGAMIAASRAGAARKGWILARGVVEILLAVILIAAAPIAAMVALLFGAGWSWAGAETLGLFLGVALLVAGFSSMGLAVVQRRSLAGRVD
jgi:uncharacterized membrane protein HdeD (DUF308 family)